MLGIAALAALIVTAALAGPASAASGGVTTTGGASTTTGGDEGVTVHTVGSRYQRLWKGFRVRDRRWAHRTSDCESGGNPRAIGGGGIYRGAFQFMRSTWKSSPRSPGGDPIAYPYRTQAVVAVLLMHRDGRGHWPVCG